MSTPAILALQDGTVFHGTSIGADGQTIGEVVFNTAMTGYQEILTDPSYCRQIVTLTYPHIGNTGTNSDDMESSKIHASGLIIRDSTMLTSSWRSERSFSDFLKQGGHGRDRRYRYAQAHAHHSREGRPVGLHHDGQADGRDRRSSTRGNFPALPAWISRSS